MSCLSVNPAPEAETGLICVSVVLPNYPHVSHLCLIVPGPLLVYLNPDSLSFWAGLSFLVATSVLLVFSSGLWITLWVLLLGLLT